jgi:hypothetical protein
VHFSGTKSGKNRSVPITKGLEKELKAAIKKSKTGRVFKYAYSAFQKGGCRVGASPWAVNACAAAYVRQSFHDERREYFGVAEAVGSFEPDHDYAVCAFSA